MFNNLKRIIPAKIRSKIYHYYKNKYLRSFSQEEHLIPKVELGREHILNLTPLLNREELLKALPTKCIVGEVGVDTGDFSELILTVAKPEKLHLIDSWNDKRYNENKKKTVEKRFEKEISGGIVELNVGLSTEVAKKFEDCYFDWIYIDTNHTYKTTKEELAIYCRKLKKGGIIAGHDFIKGNWKSMFRYGVIEAVYEFCISDNWELIYLTMENNSHPSFAIRKLTE